MNLAHAICSLKCEIHIQSLFEDDNEIIDENAIKEIKISEENDEL